MVMRRLSATETDAAGNVLRVRHRYVDMQGGHRRPGAEAAAIGVSPALEHGSAHGEDGEPLKLTMTVDAAELERQVAARMELERATIDSRIEAAREEGRQAGQLEGLHVADHSDAEHRRVIEEQRKREAELMAKVEKLERDVAALQQHATQTDGELLRLRDKFEQISSTHGQAIDRLEEALGTLGNAMAKVANDVKD